MNGYKDWQFFRFRGKRFLALTKSDGNIMVFGPEFSVYGSWMTVRNFMSDYTRFGEGLNITAVNMASDKAAR